VNVPESFSNLASGAGVSGKTERAGSGPEDNGTGIDSIALAMAGARRADACAKDRQEPAAAHLHHLAMNQSHLALAKIAEAEKQAPDWWWRA